MEFNRLSIVDALQVMFAWKENGRGFYFPYVPVSPLAENPRYQLRMAWEPCERVPSNIQLRVSLRGADSQRFTRIWRDGIPVDKFKERVYLWAFRNAARAIVDHIRLHPGTKYEIL